MRKLSLLVLLLCMTGASVSHADADGGAVSYALLIGSHRPGAGQETLTYARNDVMRMNNVLTDVGKYSAKNVEVLLDPEHWEIHQALDDVEEKLALHKGRGEKSIFLFYYSGHARANGINLGEDEISLKKLRNRLESLSSTVTLVLLDACQTGAISNIKGVQPAADFSYNSVADLNTEGMVVLASSASSELSQESRKLKGSYFTHYFTVGLRGAADGNRNGVVTLSEAYQYAYNRTLRATASTAVGKQHVTLETNLKGKGDMVLAWPGNFRSQLSLPADLAGEVLVTHKKSRTVAAEIHKVAGEIFSVAISPGEYDVLVKTSPTRAKDCQIYISDNGAENLDIGDCRELVVEKQAPKGAQVSYSLPPPKPKPMRREWIMLEASFGYFNGFDTQYTNKLEEFGYRGLNDGNALNGKLALAFSPLPYLSIVTSFSTLDKREADHDLVPSRHQSVSWQAWRVGGYLRGNLPLSRGRLVPYVQFGGGFAWADQTLEYNNNTGSGTDKDSFKGYHVAGAIGLQLNLWRYVGITLVQLEYTYAPVIEMLEELDDRHNNGGLGLLTGLRVGY